MNNKLIIMLLSSFFVSKIFGADLAKKDLLVTSDKTTSKIEEPLKIKVIEGKRVISETLEGKDIEGKLNDLRNKFDKEIKLLDQELEKEVTDLRSRARTVDAETLEKDQAKIMRKKKERDSKAESAQEEFSRTVNRELAKFNQKIQSTIIEVAEENKWDIVSVKESGEIVYTSKRVDATDLIKKAHDKKYVQAKDKTTVAVPLKK